MRVEFELGRSDTTVRYERDATTLEIGQLRLVVSRSQVALFQGPRRVWSDPPGG